MRKWNILLVGLTLLTAVFVSCVRADSYHQTKQLNPHYPLNKFLNYGENDEHI